MLVDEFSREGKFERQSRLVRNVGGRWGRRWRRQLLYRRVKCRPAVVVDDIGGQENRSVVTNRGNVEEGVTAIVVVVKNKADWAIVS